MQYLFVIDYQNDFVDGSLGFPGAEKLDAPIAAKVRSYGKGRVFFTRDTHGQDYLSTREGRNLPVVHCIRGTRGWQVYGETARALQEVEATPIDKYSFGLNPGEAKDVLPENADSIELLKHVAGLLYERGYRIGNIDATVVAQKPKLAPFIPKMRENIAAACKIDLDKVNVKATTEEGLGFTGEMLGISASCVSLIY